MKIETKKLVSLALFAALAFILVTFIRIPIVLFLKYEPKDVMITIAGFVYGPLSAFMVSIVVAFLEMITTSDSGIIGFIMNVIAATTFACTASYIYRKGNRTNKSAILGLSVATVALIIIMIGLNYFITPLYLGVPREEVVKLLVPAILPFNIIKGTLNSMFTLLLYKSVIKMLDPTALNTLNADKKDKAIKNQL